jgi:hypothetical protein
MFTNEEAASLYLREELDSVYFCTPQQLAADRAERIAA